MNIEKIYFDLIDKERNIYELATLYDQSRKDVVEYIDLLSSPSKSDSELTLDEDKVACQETDEVFAVKNNVIDFIPKKDEESNWGKLNTQFLNYHKSLSVYTLLNGTAGVNYLSYKTGLGSIKNQTVIDVGGGTGQSLCSFFLYPETLDYYLVDPNLRLLHDQFVRLYPKILSLKIGHMLAYAETLPFKSNVADLVISISSIDHFKDFKKFIKESYRVLKPGGKLLIASHLDIHDFEGNQLGLKDKIFSWSIWERISRYLYYRRYRVGHDDHTYHFEDTSPFEKAMEEVGFSIESAEIYKDIHFYVVGTKEK